MIPRAAELLSELEVRKKRFLLEIERLTDEQKGFRHHEGSWSPVQVAHHVVLAERGSVNAIMKHRGKPSRSRSLLYRLGYGAVWLVLKTGLRVKNPVPQATPAEQPDFQEIVEIWESARTDLRAHLESLQVEVLRDAAWKHPIAGPLNVEEALMFLDRHLSHHTRQLERIFDQADFPSAGSSASG